MNDSVNSGDRPAICDLVSATDVTFRDAEEPLVSIVLTCRNSEVFLRETLQSVYAQTYKNWELIAVDDASTDSTPKILQEAADGDQRVKVIRHDVCSGRPSISKNTGLKHAKGDFISFLDHDDLLLSRKIEVLLDALQKNTSCVASFHDLSYIDGAGKIGERYLTKFKKDAVDYLRLKINNVYVCNENFYVFQSLKYAALHTITCMIAPKRIPPGNTINFNTKYTICDDTDLWVRLGLMGEIAYVDEVLAQYRIHGNNITSNSLKFHRDIVFFIKNNKRRLIGKLSPNEMNSLNKRLAAAYADLGWSLRREHKPLQAAQAYFGSFLTVPSWLPLIAALKAWMPISTR